MSQLLQFLTPNIIVRSIGAVSYTHLTLPTKLEVYIFIISIA
ncbi:hypothetical protein PVA38_10850 [Streptococcus pneumoniae D39]|nr:hypothetical protein PVA38_10850 [Streptococcus pneumoniae D39]